MHLILRTLALHTIGFRSPSAGDKARIAGLFPHENCFGHFLPGNVLGILKIGTLVVPGRKDVALVDQVHQFFGAVVGKALAGNGTFMEFLFRRTMTSLRLSGSATFILPVPRTATALTFFDPRTAPIPASRSPELVAPDTCHPAHFSPAGAMQAILTWGSPGPLELPGLFRFDGAPPIRTGILKCCLAMV